ncbi:DedA family protein [Zongyangia hominis]|uniref:DedA family protein n=1 Tax=Zongyangia hominis TaxID=2763677 RepID=A0A926EF23_9FIRM|nr:DedA family protein [Zongyangia hominis]MBC8570522.1 DedA family protein [Zongyangia hominis]
MDIALLENLMMDYGLVAIFCAVALEYACFPLPSEIVLPFAGFIAVSGRIPFFAVLLVSLLAGVAGCLLCYLIGYFGGRPLVDKIAARFPSLRPGLSASEGWFSRYGSVSVLLGRCVPLFRTYISFVAGLARQRPAKFVLYSAGGIAVWNTVLISAGYLLADNWTVVVGYCQQYSVVIVPLALLAGLGYLLYKLRARRRKAASQPDPSDRK